jgi:NitT/TauT family transport system substrate-binding protein
MCRTIRGIFATAICLLLAANAGLAQTKKVVTFAYTNDVAYEPYVYAIRSGIVKSPDIDLKLVPTAIPALLQATGTKQFDLIETSPLGIAIGSSRGLDARIAGTAGIVRGGRFLFVKKNSPIKSASDLKGKSVGATALASTLVAHIRAVLQREYRLNVSLENGDIHWVELPLPALPSALDRGQIDSAYLIHLPSLRALQSGDFRVLVDMTKEFKSEFGIDPLTSVVGTYDSKIAKMGPSLHEAMSMLRASSTYAKDHPAEVLAAVAKNSNISVSDLKTISEDWYDVPFTLAPEDEKMIQTILEIGKEEKLISTYPPLEKLIWK